MDEFDRLYAEVKAEKRKRQQELKRAKRVSDRLGLACKILDKFSKSVENGSVEKIIRSFSESN